MSEKEYDPQMHTIEHILNGTIAKRFGCGRAFSAHIEKKKSKLDFKFDRNITAQELYEIENQVNEILLSGVDVFSTMMPIEEAKIKFDLSRLPEDVDNELRIVSIGDYDHCPCIGTHVNSTLDIEGRLKIISSDFDSERSVLRIRFKLVFL